MRATTTSCPRLTHGVCWSNTPRTRMQPSTSAAEPSSRSQRLKPARSDLIAPVQPATQRVALRVVPRGGGAPIAVKLHVHGAAGEYLRLRTVTGSSTPRGSRTTPSTSSTETCTRPRTLTARRPCACPPARSMSRSARASRCARSARWSRSRRRRTRSSSRSKRCCRGVSAVGSPQTPTCTSSHQSPPCWRAGEGVNVVNLLASQWGELMTNVGDFDGQTTWGTPGAGGSGEYLVRVGTENRQHVLGHISLLGYRGRIIAPMTTGGPDESALGDPVDVLLTEWKRRCKAQGGLVVLPHFPNPRRTRRQHRPRRHRRAGDDLLGGPLQRHQPLFAGRLVSLSQLRLSRRGRRRHGQDERQHCGRHRAHLCAYCSRRAVHL